jgi:RHS repeat-associated protein
LASENPYRYAGYRYDEETGLYYLMARYYDANIGRFLTKDTFRGLEDEPQSLNQYAYTKNNPVMYVDPDGHHPGLLVAALVTALRVIGVYGFRVTWHVGLRMLQRHVNPKLVAQAIKYGRIYYDPWYGSLVYWYCSLAVAVSGKAITTVYWGPPKKRWKRIK